MNSFLTFLNILVLGSTSSCLRVSSNMIMNGLILICVKRNLSTLWITLVHMLKFWLRTCMAVESLFRYFQLGNP